MSNPFISASILSADSGYLVKEAKSVLQAGADSLHIDVMDNHYVPHLSFGPQICAALHAHLIKRHPRLFLDVHLMVKPVDALINAFAQAKANRISFHPDASDNVKQNLEQIHQLGCKAGLAISPEISLDCLDTVWQKLDFILIMSVHPGRSGQDFIPEVLKKISAAQRLIQQKNSRIHLGVDGGIKKDNIHAIANAGADTLVLGSGIFNTPDYTKTLKELRSHLNQKAK